jgi:hypothetical protein
MAPRGVGALRFWFPHLVVAALVLVVAVLVLTSMEGEARRYILTDGFNGPDLSAPDTSKWEVNALHGTGEVYVGNGLLHTNMNGHQHCDAVMLNDFTNENVTLTVDFKVVRDVERSVEIGYLWNVGSTGYAIIVYYDQEGWDYLGVPGSPTGDLRNVQVGHWYTIEFNVTQNVLDFHLVDRANNETVMSFEDLQLPDGGDRHHFSIGVGSYTDEEFPYTEWDNFTLYDPSMEPNVLPRWLTVPALHATEDVVLVYDFSGSIYDDQPPGELTITSSSPYVVDIDGLEVSFLFPNNVTGADVPLVLSDGYASVPNTVRIDVTPVNDPPEHNIPTTLNAPEGVATTIDLSPYIWDIDSDPGDLLLLISSPVVSVNGLKLEVGFPEGMTEYQVQLGISDGYDINWTTLYFIITPLNNPPRLLPIDDFTVTEDEPYLVDISALVSDPDDDLSSLMVTVSSDHCSVDGMLLVFDYPQGDYTDTVTVRVSDGFGSDHKSFNVRILPKNDPPVIDAIPVQEVLEDETTRIDVEEWVHDEDSTIENLVLEAEHANLVSVVGLDLLVLFTDGGFNETISFTVSDGYAETTGQLRLHVVEVNDQPRITGLGNLQAPYDFGVPSDSVRTFRIVASDTDDEGLSFSVDSSWDIFSISGDQLVVDTDQFREGTYIAYLNVYDGRGGTHRVKLSTHVVRRGDLPVEVHIVSPINHSAFEEEDEIDLRVRVLDPEGYLGEDITVTWSSDLVGDLATVDVADGGEVAISDMPAGRHRIEVTVTDGDLVFKHWVEVKVGQVSTGVEEDEGNALCTVLVLLAIIIIMGIIVGVIVHRAGKDLEPEPSRARAAAVRASAERVPAPQAMVTDTAREERLRRDLEARRKRVAANQAKDRAESARATREEEARMARIRAQQEVEARRKAAEERRFAAQKAPEPRPVPETRVHLVKVPPKKAPTAVRRELPSEETMRLQRKLLMDALGKLPGGLPSSLSLYDESTISERIIKGRKRWSPDGRLLAFVQGDWYYVDPGDPGFMNRYEGP